VALAQKTRDRHFSPIYDPSYDEPTDFQLLKLWLLFIGMAVFVVVLGGVITDGGIHSKYSTAVGPVSSQSANVIQDIALSISGLIILFGTGVCIWSAIKRDRKRKQDSLPTKLS